MDRTGSINRDVGAPETRRSSKLVPFLDQETCVSFSGLPSRSTVVGWLSRHTVSYNSGGWRSMVKLSAGLVSSEAFLLGPQ